MLFAFRGIRVLQVILAVAALWTGVGTAIMAKVYADEGSIWLALATVALGLSFVWLFAATLKAPTSFVAISNERTRIRFGGFVDVIVANSNIAGAAMAKHRLIGGLGVRTDFRGDVALVSATGDVAMLSFREPVRIWVIPRVLPAKARRLSLSVRNPEKLVERFGTPTPAPARTAGPNQKRRRGS